MKVALITTIKHNVGDDFIREGAKYILTKYYNKQNLNFSYIHKHIPTTVRSGFEKLRSKKWSERIEKYIPIIPAFDKILQSEVVVQCGAPLYWYHPGITNCIDGNEWYEDLIKKRYDHQSGSKKLYNLAVGSCQKYDSDASEFLDTEAKKVIDYIHEFYNITDVTTVRDTLAKKILNTAKCEPSIIPCSSLFAKDYYNIKKGNGKYAILNYMPNGGHFGFGQNIDGNKWNESFVKLHQKLSKYEEVKVVCHNLDEKNNTLKILPNADIFYSDNYLDYLEFYSNSKFGIVNRIHSAYIIASYGKPILLVGADSRAKMAAEIDLESIFVNDASYEMLMDKYHELLLLENKYEDKMQYLKEKSLGAYLEALESAQ